VIDRSIAQLASSSLMNLNLNLNVNMDAQSELSQSSWVGMMHNQVQSLQHMHKVLAKSKQFLGGGTGAGAGASPLPQPLASAAAKLGSTSSTSSSKRPSANAGRGNRSVSTTTQLSLSSHVPLSSTLGLKHRGGGVSKASKSAGSTTTAAGKTGRRARGKDSGKFIGISQYRQKKWEAHVWAKGGTPEGGEKGKQLHLGYFTNPLSAARAYDRAALFLRGKAASLNMPAEEYAKDPVMAELRRCKREDFLSRLRELSGKEEGSHRSASKGAAKGAAAKSPHKSSSKKPSSSTSSSSASLWKSAAAEKQQGAHSSSPMNVNFGNLGLVPKLKGISKALEDNKGFPVMLNSPNSPDCSSTVSFLSTQMMDPLAHYLQMQQETTGSTLPLSPQHPASALAANAAANVGSGGPRVQSHWVGGLSRGHSEISSMSQQGALGGNWMVGSQEQSGGLVRKDTGAIPTLFNSTASSADHAANHANQEKVFKFEPMSLHMSPQDTIFTTGDLKPVLSSPAPVDLATSEILGDFCSSSDINATNSLHNMQGMALPHVYEAAKPVKGQLYIYPSCMSSDSLQQHIDISSLL